MKHWANQMIFIRNGQGADAPMNEQKRYFLDKEDKLRYKTEKIKVGFDSVMKLEKTKSSKSAKENSVIHVPFLYKDVFVNEFNPTNQDIEITGTDEQKEKIKEELHQKGILLKRSKDYKETGETTIIFDKKPTKKDIISALIPPKKKRDRGRPKGSKNKKEK